MGFIKATRCLVMTVTLCLLYPSVNAQELSEKEQIGRDLMMDITKANCIGCHKLPEAQFWGNIGPELMGVTKRMTLEQIRERIWDATAINPFTIMWPFGKHKILTEEEIDQIVEYLKVI